MRKFQNPNVVWTMDELIIIKYDDDILEKLKF